ASELQTLRSSAALTLRSFEAQKKRHAAGGARLRSIETHWGGRGLGRFDGGRATLGERLVPPRIVLVLEPRRPHRHSQYVVVTRARGFPRRFHGVRPDRGGGREPGWRGCRGRLRLD